MNRRLLERLVAAAVAIASSLAADGATITVTTDADDGVGSLRAAIVEAESNGEADLIVFAGDTTILLASDLPSISTPISIRGNGWDRTVIDGGNPAGGTTGVQVFRLHSGGQLVLDGVMVQNGYGGTSGGAVDASFVTDATLVVRNSRLERNRAGYGGAISFWDRGELVIEDSVLAGNEAVGGSGGAIHLGGLTSKQAEASIVRTVLTGNSARFGGAVATWGNWRLQLRDSLVAGNRARDRGGGLSVYRAEIVNSTISGNLVDTGEGGGVWASESRLLNLTIVDNHAPVGGGLRNGGAVSVENTIIAGNGADNCAGPVASHGHNLEDADSCGLWVTLGDLIGVDPMLGELTDNGGPTPSRALRWGSPAVDRGDAARAPTSDQCGLRRPADGDGDGHAAVDIGAFELQPEIFADGFESGSTAMWSATNPVHR